MSRPTKSPASSRPIRRTTATTGGGEDNGDAHLKNLLVHHQVIVPVTEGRLDLGPWPQVYYCEFDGGQPTRLVIKLLGE